MVEAGVDVLFDRFEMALRVGAADHRFGDLLGGGLAGGLLEVRRRRQFLAQLAAKRRVGPDFERGALGLGFAGGPADCHLTIARPLTTGARKSLNDLRFGGGADQAIAEAPSSLGSLWPSRRYNNAWQLLRQ